MPANPVIGMTRTRDGIELRHARWKTGKTNAKGTIILLGGRSEYIEKQYETIKDLLENSFDVLAFDWRGQGGSSRMIGDTRKGFVENFNQYVIDLEAILNDVALPDCRAPYFILAHSTGSLVALLAAPNFANRIHRMVLASPMLALAGLPLSQKFMKFITGTLHVTGLGKVYMQGGATPEVNRAFDGNKLTSDPERFRRNAEFAGEFRDLTIGGPTASWVFAACRAMDTVMSPDFAGNITIPTLLVCAGNDNVVNNAAAEELGRRMRSGKAIFIPGAKHELLQERDIFREQLLAAVYSFLPGSKPGEKLTMPTRTNKPEKPPEPDTEEKRDWDAEKIINAVADKITTNS